MTNKKIVVKGFALLVVFFFLSAPTAYSQLCKGDFNCDGMVTGAELGQFAVDFGRQDCPACGPALVPKTGQKTSYHMADDGLLEKGVAWPNPRFTDNGDGTVTDNLTGLIWLKNANCFGLRSWTEAIFDSFGLAAGDNLCISGTFSLSDGSSMGDWRLPNRFELESLLDLEYVNPALPNTTGTGQWSEGIPFDDVQSAYWSSTTYAFNSPSAWYVSINGGNANDNLKTSSYYVWPVRGGQ